MPLRAANIRQAQRVLGNRMVQRLVGPGAGGPPAPTLDRGATPAETIPPANAAGAGATLAPSIGAPPAGAPGSPPSPAPSRPATAAAAAPVNVAAPARAPTGEVADQSTRSSAPQPDAQAATAPTAASPVDQSSSAALLQSLGNVPASLFGGAVAQAAGALPALQAREKQAAQDAIPSIDAPTGLPTVAAPHVPAPTTLPPGQPKGAQPPPAGKVAPPAPTPSAPGPLPGSEVSVAAPEPEAVEDGGGSWWSWLADRLHNFFFGSLPTTDPNLSTSAGPRQRLSLEADADPSQNEHERLAGTQSVQAGRLQADQATSAQFGENAIAPTIPRTKARATYRQTPPRPPAHSTAPAASALPANEREAFDEQTSPWVKAHVAEQDDAYKHEHAVYQRAAKQAQEDGERQLAQENERTRVEQVAMREGAKADVSGARQRWRDENRKIEAEFGDKASAKRRDVDRDIAQKVETTHRDADAALDEAEKKGEAEKTKAEDEAAAKKREAEDQPRSWWDRAKGAVSSVFSAIRSAVTAVFDKLRQVVKGIIDAAKKAVHALIEAARSVIVGLIRAFGEFIKGLVTVALAAFPEAAAKARAWIDDRVKAATDAVNRAAKALERAADAILDGIAKAIDAALDILQTVLTKALDVLEKLALLPFQAMEALAKLVEWLAKNGNFVQAALQLEAKADSVIEGLKNWLGGMIAAVPAQAHAKLQQFTASLGDGARIVAPPAPAPAAARSAPGSTTVQRAPAPDAAPPAKRHVPASQHLAGVLRHLDKGLTYLKDHWWDELKKVGWNLLWPWPAVWGDLKDIWKEIKAGYEDAYHLRVSKVIDHVLAIAQKFNSILGNLYGWFAIASVLVGAIFGGGIPGALAGAAVAAEVGEALVAGLIATETAVIVKAVADLAIGNDTAAEDEADYDKIAGSTLTIAITAAMMLLGEIAAKLAKSIWDGVAGLLKGEKAPEVKVEVDGEPAKPADTPEAKGEKPEIVDGEQVVAHEPTSDGHEVKITDEGRCLICSTCEDIEVRYKEELKGDRPEIEGIKKELEEAKQMPNGEAKAQAIEKIKERLDKVRSETRAAEPLGLKTGALDKANTETLQALDEVTKALDRDAVKKAGADPALKDAIDKLRQEASALDRKWQDLQAEIDGALSDVKEPATAEDPARAEAVRQKVDRLRDQLEDVRAEAERIKRDVENRIGESDVAEPPPSTKNVPKPTPQEYALIDRYTKALEDLRSAREAKDSQAMEAANKVMQDIEDQALAEYGKGGPLTNLVDHIDSLAIDRTRINAGDMPFGTGIRSNSQAAQFGEFRGKTFSEVENAIGRPPDQIEGRLSNLERGQMPSGAVRLTWRLQDGSLIHVDVPGLDNPSPFELNRNPHAARVDPDGVHLSDSGIGVPERSTPAHIEIRADARLREVITSKKGGQ